MTDTKDLCKDISNMCVWADELFKTAHDMNEDAGQASEPLREIMAQLSAAASALGVAKRRAGELIP